MSRQSQISATISAATKERLDRFSESYGLKKNFVVEQALLFFMEARRIVPDEALIPTRIVLEDDAVDSVIVVISATDFGVHLVEPFRGLRERYPNKPLFVICLFGSRSIYERMSKQLQAFDIPVYSTSERAMFALGALHKYRLFLSSLENQ